jgi:4-hydroxy-tetrahydrodipicolinate reductase
MKRIALAGASGKMGQEVIAAIDGADDLELVACIDPTLTDGEGACGSTGSCRCFSEVAAALDATEPDVFVDFTRPDAVEGNLREALSRNIDCVVGTTGLSAETLDELSALGDEDTTLFVAPNFAIGAVLLMRFATEASKIMETAEIIESHHPAKLDKPSGTALRTAELMAGEPAIHSVRLPGLVANQEVLFGDVGQTLSIKHETIDRSSFMPGVLLACREVGNRNGLIVGLEHLMEGE